jgi:ATP-dependent DNA helicase RecG
MTPHEERALIEALIAGGESYYVEFKGAWDYGPGGRQKRDLKAVAGDIAEELVAFANAEGGDLLVGVEDNGERTGLPWEGDPLQYLVNAPKELIHDGGVDVRVRTPTVDGVRVLWFRVEAAETVVVTSQGRCLMRRGTQSEPVTPAEIERLRAHRRGDLAYEAAPVPTAALTDLNEEIIRSSLLHGTSLRSTTATELRESRTWTLARLSAMPLEQLLRYWNLIESRNGSTVLRRAALLLFAREPLRWHPNNRLRIRRVHGSDESFGRTLATREREVSGPIVDLLPRAIRTFARELAVERRQQSLSLFSTTQLLPREAVEECVVNAAVHRNYAVAGQAIEVLLYPERIEVHSPGRLPEPITLRDLREQRGVHRSRNPLIMRVLRDLGWSRDQGEGMRRIFGSMRQVELHEPELEEKAGTFIIRLSTTSIYDESTQAWIAAYGPFGLRAEDRKVMVQLRGAGGKLSVDKLARKLREPFDQTKQRLQRLERFGLVWHPHKSRTYHLVEATSVPHELALRAFKQASVNTDLASELSAQVLGRVLGPADDSTLRDRIVRWQQAGILQPAGMGRWKLGTSFLQYLSTRH